jgi:DNA-binding LacI/PurR family transcriptional regulator
MGHFQAYAGTLRRRVDGYRAALAQYGLEIDGKKVRLIECSSTESGGEMGFEHTWKGKYRPTAIVAMSDIIAIGAMKAAQEIGVCVPADLSIAGFDDLPLSSLVNPPLTTVAQPLTEKGRLAGALLIKTIDGEHDPTHHRLPTRLVVRSSVARII